MTTLSDSELRHELDQLQGRLLELRRALGDRAVAEPLPAEAFDVLVCRVGEELLAFMLDEIDEVVQMAMLVALPEADPWVSGLLDLGGVLLPVLDLGARLTQAPRRRCLDDLILIATTKEGRCGLVVQELLDVERVDPSQLEERGIHVPRASYVRGVWSGARGPSALLSVTRLIGLAAIPSMGECEDEQ